MGYSNSDCGLLSHRRTQKIQVSEALKEFGRATYLRKIAMLWRYKGGFREKGNAECFCVGASDACAYKNSRSLHFCKFLKKYF